MPICRILLMSFVAFARSKALERAGTAKASRMPIPAITTSSSIRVKARSTWGGELLAMDFVVRITSYCVWGGSKSEKERQRQDCLTSKQSFCVCRSCPTKRLFHPLESLFHLHPRQ